MLRIWWKRPGTPRYFPLAGATSEELGRATRDAEGREVEVAEIEARAG